MLWKNHLNKRLVVVFVMLLLCLTVINIPFNSRAEDDNIKLGSQSINFEHSGSVHTDFSSTSPIMAIEGDIGISAGVELPVEVSYTVPEQVHPGEDFFVLVDGQGKDGLLWFSMDGNLVCDMWIDGNDNNYQGSYSIPKTTLLEFDVTMGEDKIQVAQTEEILLGEWTHDYTMGERDYYMDFSVRVMMELEMKTTSHVSGDIFLDGRSLGSPMTAHHIWDGSEPYIGTTNAIEESRIGDKIDFSVNNLKYHLEDVRVSVNRFMIYVGYESNHEQLGNNSKAIEIDISMEDLSKPALIDGSDLSLHEFTTTYVTMNSHVSDETRTFSLDGDCLLDQFYVTPFDSVEERNDNYGEVVHASEVIQMDNMYSNIDISARNWLHGLIFSSPITLAVLISSVAVVIVYPIKTRKSKKNLPGYEEDFETSYLFRER